MGDPCPAWLPAPLSSPAPAPALQGKGIIGLKYRPIPCELGLDAEQKAAEQQRVVAAAGSPWDRCVIGTGSRGQCVAALRRRRASLQVCMEQGLGERADCLITAERAVCWCAMPRLLCRMYRALYYGASPDVFANGDLGIGWQKVGAARASRAAPGLGAGALEQLLRRLHTRHAASCPAPLLFSLPALQTAYMDSKKAMYT